MNSLLFNIRFYVLLLSFSISLVLLFLYPDSYERARINGITAVIFLYFTLLAGPIARVFPSFPFRGIYLKARRALGVSVFYFALLHFLSTIDYMGGITTVLSLIPQSPPILAGLISLIILTLLAVTASDAAVNKLTFPKWKFLHRFIYLVEILIVIHIVMLGSHFADRGFLFILLIIAILILVSLQLFAFVKQKGLNS